MPHHVRFARLTLVEQPLLAAGTAFLTGILISRYLSLSSNLAIASAVGMWMAFGFAIAIRSSLAPLMFITTFTALGVTILSVDAASVSRLRLKRQIEAGMVSADEVLIVTGVLANSPELAPDRILLEVDAERLQDRQLERPAAGRIRAIVFLTEARARQRYDSLALEYGQRVRMSCQLRRPAGYRNPGVVSLHAILDQKGLDATTTLKSPASIESIGRGPHSDILRVLYQTRSMAISVLLRRLKQPASGLLVASLFGNQNFLDRRVAEGFRSGGTYHLLVISGLHLAMIAWALLLAIRRLVRQRALRFMIVVVAIWAFALMVGAQPAVTRAAAMISIALLSQGIFRRGSGANALGASAILLLTWAPTDLFNPGFQLSFLTVLVIVLGTSPLYERLRAIGQWEPTETTPYPPACSRALRSISEVIFWNEREFRQKQGDSHIRYRVEKAAIARAFSTWRLSWLIRAAFGTVLTTVAIQLALLPVMVLYFHRVSLVAPLSNVVEAALLGLLMTSGCGLLAFNPLGTIPGDALSSLTNWFGELLIQFSHRVDLTDGASFRTPDYGDYSLLVYVPYFALSLVWAFLLSTWNPLAPPARRPLVVLRRMRLVALTGMSVVMIWIVAIHPFPPRLEKGRLVLTLLDVGQGDAMTITFPAGHLMQLDSGGRMSFGAASGDSVSTFLEDRPGIGEVAIAPYLWHLGIKDLDFVAATHSDADHVQGFLDIIPAFGIQRAFAVPPVAAWDVAFPDRLLTGRIRVENLKRGDRLEIDGVSVDVLAPFEEMLSARYSPNDRSLVLRLRYRDVVFLLTGDIERRTENMLLAAGDTIAADVLKVAHHGSRTSTSQAFLDRVKPRVALISAGSPSPFGHPHADILSRLEKAGGRVLQTPRCGAITVSTDGYTLEHRTFVRCD